MIRVVGGIAIVGIAVTSILDLRTDYWARHAMITAYVSGLLLIALGTAVINEFLSNRALRRWRTVAALAITQLRDSARRLAVEVGALLDIGDDDQLRPASLAAVIRESDRAGHDTAIAGIVLDHLREPGFVARLCSCIERALPTAQDVAAAWAPTMVSEASYVWLLDEYVDLLNRIWRVRWALSVDASERPESSPSAAAVARELADVVVDLVAFQSRATEVIRSLLPWPAEFGPAPSA